MAEAGVAGNAGAGGHAALQLAPRHPHRGPGPLHEGESGEEDSTTKAQRTQRKVTQRNKI